MHGMSEILSADTQDDENLSGIDTPPRQSPVASAVLQLAATYQLKASDKRLYNKVRTQAVGKPELEQGLNKLPYKNLGKAHKIVEDRKVKNNEAKLLDDGIRVGATLWSADTKAAKEVCSFSLLSKLSKLTFSNQFKPTLRIVHRFEQSEKTCNALDLLLGGVREQFENEYPNAKQLTW